MIKITDTNVIIPKPKKVKKITGTRFATILGKNEWQTPFEAWCDITNTYKEPFEDTIYTIAGKTIEPIQINYIKNNFLVDLKTPESVYGENYFYATRGDFFNDNIFGGMWDALDTKEEAVYEFKTTKRVEDWKGEPPVYYYLQAFLYAYLLKYKKVVIVVSFLEDKNYIAPENFKCSNSNTTMFEFDFEKDYLEDFKALVNQAINFYYEHVMTGISPKYTKKDEDIIKILSTKTVDVNMEESDILKELIELTQKEDGLKEQLKPIVDSIKRLKSMLVVNNEKKFNDNVKTLELPFDNNIVVMSKRVRNSTDTNKLKEDGLYESYLKTTNYTTISIKKEAE